MKKQKVLCNHAHICRKIESPLKCEHQKKHLFHDLCERSRCDFLTNLNTELKEEVIVICNMNHDRKKKLNKLNEKAKSNL